jgi:hypothetical protein
MGPKASPGKKKGRDPLTKRFTNGHKCFTAMQSKFMVEIMAKDEEKRLSFEDNKYILKADRNPVAGELTARDNAPYLVVFDSSKFANTGKNAPKDESSASAISTIVDSSRLKGSTQMLSVVREVERCERLKARRELLEEEAKMVEQVLAHKRVCAQVGFTGMGMSDAKFGKTSPSKRPF